MVFHINDGLTQQQDRVVVNSSTSVHPFGAGFAVPPGRDTAAGARARALARASAQLARVPPSERALRVRALLQSSDESALAEWVAEQVLLASPEAAASTNGLENVRPQDDLSMAAALPHLLTDSELAQFHRQGFFVVRDALDQSKVSQLLDASDRIDSVFRERMGIAVTERMDLLDCLGAAFATDKTSSAGVGSAGQQFLDLVDLSTTFPKVWGLMGPNISLYHTQVSVQPPLPPGTQRERLGWHRDSGNLNTELEGNAAMVSLKVGFFLTDAAESTGFTCVPGSHLPLTNGQFEQAPRYKDPPSAVSVSMKAGDAIVPTPCTIATIQLYILVYSCKFYIHVVYTVQVFDRRLLHAGKLLAVIPTQAQLPSFAQRAAQRSSPKHLCQSESGLYALPTTAVQNLSTSPRVAIFYGYSLCVVQ